MNLSVKLRNLLFSFFSEQECAQLLEEVYAGCWGFNTILSMSALSCVFLAFNSASVGLGLVNVGATILTQFLLRSVMTLQVNYCVRLITNVFPISRFFRCPCLLLDVVKAVNVNKVWRKKILYLQFSVHFSFSCENIESVIFFLLITQCTPFNSITYW